MESKICSCCKDEKLFDQFYKSKSSKDGLCSECKSCRKKSVAKWAKENPEKKKESNRKWAKENPEKNKESNRKYYKKNSERINVYAVKWRNENPEKSNEINRKWAKKNPEKIKLITKNIVSNLSDNYIINQIENQVGLSRESIKKHPELIESKKLSIKIKRLLKQKKDENTETS